MTRYKLIDIGRNKVNREVDVKSDRQLYKEVCSHLMSRDVDIISEDDGATWMERLL